MPAGVSGSFREGCHSAATAGKQAARLFVEETRRPAQKGQPFPSDVRLFGVAAHSWSGPTAHFHQMRAAEPYETSWGDRTPFLIGCHSATRLG
jgi:hypothetical protein